MGALLLIFLGISLIAPEIMSFFGMMMPALTPGSLLLDSFMPPWAVHVIPIVVGLWSIRSGARSIQGMLRRRHQAERGLIDGYGRRTKRSEDPDE
jgi:hypothetical protein